MKGVTFPEAFLRAVLMVCLTAIAIVGIQAIIQWASVLVWIDSQKPRAPHFHAPDPELRQEKL